MVELDKLKHLTQEIANEIHEKQHGKAFEFIKLLFDNIKSFVAVVDGNCKIIYVNPAVIKFANENSIVDIKLGDNCKMLFSKTKFECDNCVVKSCINQRRVLSEEVTSKYTGIKYRLTCIPLAYDGIAGVIEIVERIYG